MALLTEGTWPCIVLSATFGDNFKGLPSVEINVEWSDGPDIGRRGTYSQTIDAKQAPYAIASCKAVGWKGRDWATLKADCESWIAQTGGATTVEVRHLERTNGPKAGQIWDKINSIGRGLQAPSSRSVADANALLAQMAEQQADEAPPVTDEDIPF